MHYTSGGKFCFSDPRVRSTPDLPNLLGWALLPRVPAGRQVHFGRRRPQTLCIPTGCRRQDFRSSKRDGRADGRTTKGMVDFGLVHCLALGRQPTVLVINFHVECTTQHVWRPHVGRSMTTLVLCLYCTMLYYSVL